MPRTTKRRRRGGRTIAGNVAAIAFFYLLIFHYRTFAAFWTPILAIFDPSGNIAAIVALITPVVIGIAVGQVVYMLGL